jgi:hypothetical protein
VLERGVVAVDAVELLGALVRGNGDERATGAGGVVRELAGQAAQAREAGTADALGEGREEEDRVRVATHDLRDESSLPDSTRRRRAGRAASDGAPASAATARDASLAQLQRAATSPKSGSRRNTRPSDRDRNREIAKRELQMCSRSAAAAAALSPRRPRRFGRGRRFPWSSRVPPDGRPRNDPHPTPQAHHAPGSSDRTDARRGARDVQRAEASVGQNLQNSASSDRRLTTR